MKKAYLGPKIALFFIPTRSHDINMGLRPIIGMIFVMLDIFSYNDDHLTQIIIHFFKVNHEP